MSTSIETIRARVRMERDPCRERLMVVIVAVIALVFWPSFERRTRRPPITRQANGPAAPHDRSWSTERPARSASRDLRDEGTPLSSAAGRAEGPAGRLLSGGRHPVAFASRLPARAATQDRGAERHHRSVRPGTDLTKPLRRVASSDQGPEGTETKGGAMSAQGATLRRGTIELPIWPVAVLVVAALAAAIGMTALDTPGGRGS